MRILFFLALMITVNAQQKLTIEQAIAIALNKNFDIQIAKYDVELADNAVRGKLNVFLPSAQGDIDVGTYRTKATSFFAGQPFSQDETNTFISSGLGVQIGIQDIVASVLDYMREMDVNKETKYRITNNIQATIQNVMRNYYDLAKAKNILEVRERAVQTGIEQVKQYESRYEIGFIPKKDVFQQKVQLGQSRQALLAQQLDVQTKLNALNISLGNDPFAKLEVDEKVVIENKFSDFSELERTFEEKNPVLKQDKLTVSNSEKVAQAAMIEKYAPSVNFNMGYTKSIDRDTTFGDNLDKLFDFSNNFSTYVRVGLQYDFSYGEWLDDERAEIAVRKAMLTQEKNRRELKATLYQAHITYKNSLESLKLNEEQVLLARENLKLNQERFNLGSGTTIELRQAQDELTEAEINLVNAQFDAKLAEVAIEKLLGLIDVGVL